jgi:hypothetical protein
MVISKALIKHGYSNFRLEILEYCTAKKTIEREQYYLDLLQAEYNTLKKAGSSQGFRHSDESKSKMKQKALTPERLEELKRRNEGFKGRERPEGSGRPSFFIEVFDTKNNETNVYGSLSEAALAIGVNKASISRALKRKGAGSINKEVATTVLIKKRYQLTKLL